MVMWYTYVSTFLDDIVPHVLVLPNRSLVFSLLYRRETKINLLRNHGSACVVVPNSPSRIPLPPTNERETNKLFLEQDFDMFHKWYYLTAHLTSHFLAPKPS